MMENKPVVIILKPAPDYFCKKCQKELNEDEVDVSPEALEDDSWCECTYCGCSV